MKPCIRILFLCLSTVILFSLEARTAPIPVIFDTDIGSDIDDTWALSLLLCSPELDLKMVVTDSHDTTARAKIVAKFLEQVGRTDVEIGIGVKTKDIKVPQAKWADDYDLSQYPGKVHEDGIQAMIDTIQNSPEAIRLLVVGPCPNIPILLQKYPDMVNRVSVYAMSGSVYKGYGDRPSPDAEYNIREDIAASQKMYKASWKLTITPLDTCGIVSLMGSPYQELIQMQNKSPLIRALFENYNVWTKETKNSTDPANRSTILFDTVAVYLAIENSLCKMEDLNLVVDDRGYTVIDPKGQTVSTATQWNDLEAYQKWLIARLEAGVVKKKAKAEK